MGFADHITVPERCLSSNIQSALSNSSRKLESVIGVIWGRVFIYSSVAEERIMHRFAQDNVKIDVEVEELRVRTETSKAFLVQSGEARAEWRRSQEDNADT